MSQRNLCRLCVKVATGYTSLYDDTGKQNRICEITLKYFHPMFLHVDQTPELAVLCLECCRHISEFYNFQQSVFQAQKSILEDEMELDIEPKTKMSDVVIVDDSRSHFIIKQDDPELMKEVMSADNCEHDEISSHNANDDPANCIIDNESGDTKEMININNSKSEQSSDDAVYISDSSDSEEENNSNDGQQTTSVKRKRRPSSKDHDALIAQWKPQLECVVCNQSLSNFNSLKSHFRDEHPDERCRVECCQRRFYKRYKLMDHVRHHLNPETFKCDECDYCNVSKTALYLHMRSVHYLEHKDNMTNPKFKCKTSVECVVCKATYPNFYVLVHHFRQTHPNEAPYVMCCERKFNRSTLFELHMRLHRDPNAFKCEICGKSMSRPDSLRVHMGRAHSNTQTAP